MPSPDMSVCPCYVGLAERLKNGNPYGEFNEAYSLCQLEIQRTTE